MSNLPTDAAVLRRLSTNLRRLLADRNWSQGKLARAIGMDPMTVSRVIRGQTMPGAGTVTRIAKVLNTSIDRLTGPPPKRKSRNS